MNESPSRRRYKLYILTCAGNFRFVFDITFNTITQLITLAMCISGKQSMTLSLKTIAERQRENLARSVGHELRTTVQ